MSGIAGFGNFNDIRPGMWRGTIVNNKDPDGRLRVQVRVPQLHGGAESTTTVPTAVVPDNLLPWAEPCFPFGGSANQGFVMLPPVGSVVWVSFEHGYIERPVYMGAWYGTGDKPTEITDPNKDRVIKTPGGHVIHLEDPGENGGLGRIRIFHTDGKRKLTLDADAQKTILQDASGRSLTIDDGMKKTTLLNGAGQTIEISETDKKVTVTNSAQTVTLDDVAHAITLEQGAQRIKMDLVAHTTKIENSPTQYALLDAVLQEISFTNAPAQYIKASLISGNIDLLTGATALQMALAGTITATAATKASLTAPLVDLGVSGLLGVVLDAFATLYNAHTHLTTPGVSGPPLAPAVAGVHYSTTVKAQP